jgi:hypothetical protein
MTAVSLPKWLPAIFFFFLIFSDQTNAQSKKELYAKIETLLNKAKGKIVTIQNHQYVLGNQVFHQDSISLTVFTDNSDKIGYRFFYGGLDWESGFDGLYFESDPNNGQLKVLRIMFEKVQQIRMFQGVKVLEQQKDTVIESLLFCLKEDNKEINELLSKIEKQLQTN